MNDKLITVLVAAGSAIVGGLISSVLGPVLKHTMEQSAAKKTRQRCQIQKWRNMVSNLAQETEGSPYIQYALQQHPDFLSLQPHLSVEANRSVYAEIRVVVLGSALQGPLSKMSDEISRIEKKWGLH